VIDLHLHTTASDGRSSPEALIRRAAAAGITTLAVTDHDTMAGIAAARSVAAPLGIAVVPGIEITSVHNGKDVHMLGYFIDEAHPELAEFLVAQRADRRRRIEDMLDRLDGLGVVLDRAPLMSQAEGKGKAIGRPVIARALIEGGHAKDMSDAFDRCRAYLRENGVDLGTTPATLGPWVTYDAKQEKFVRDFAEQANALSKRDYREPYVVPKLA